MSFFNRWRNICITHKLMNNNDSQIGIIATGVPATIAKSEICLNGASGGIAE
jgi:hypothetical protein